MVFYINNIMTIFQFESYRKAFSSLFKAQRDINPSWTASELAEKIRVQTSHLTNVIKERSHFSSDQIFSIGAELGLSKEETEYLDLLKDWERAEFPPRREKLQSQIRQIRDRNLRAKNELLAKELELTPESTEKYYLDPNVQLIHFFLGTKDAPAEADEIGALWGFSTEYVADILRFLQKMGLIELKRNKWIVHRTHIQLHPESTLAKPHQLLKRMRINETLQKSSADESYTFSGTLTMTEDTRLFIQGRFVEFLKEIEKTVIDSPSHHIYHLQFDLFPWLKIGRKK